MSPTACVNTILIHLGRFLRIKRGLVEFNKHRIVSRYLKNEPPFINYKILHLIERFLVSEKTSKAEDESLRKYTKLLGEQMNAYLGISV